MRALARSLPIFLLEYPTERRKRIRVNSMMNMLNREIRRRTRMVSSFPDGNSALIFFYARIQYVATNKRNTRRYLDIS